MAAGCGGNCSCDWAGEAGVACAFRRVELISETASRTPQKGRIALDRSFTLVFNSNLIASIGTHLLKMWFPAV